MIAATDWGPVLTQFFAMLSALIGAIVMWIQMVQKKELAELKVKATANEVAVTKIEQRTNSLDGVSKDTIAAQAKILARIPGASEQDIATAERTAKIAEDHREQMARENAAAGVKPV